MTLPHEVVEFTEQVTKEVERYILANPWLLPHRDEFARYVFAREGAVLKKERLFCELYGIKPSDREFEIIQTAVESFYPTWEEIVWHIFEEEYNTTARTIH